MSGSWAYSIKNLTCTTKIDVMLTEEVNIYEDFAEFIDGLSPEKILAYHAPPKVQKRIDFLVERKKTGAITEAESTELEKYFLFEHIVRLAKARALKHRAKMSS